MYAIEAAARDGDRTSLRRIVEQLDSDDPAVRSLAIASLHRLTGHTLGYRDYDSPAEREAAVERWVEALNDGRIDSALENASQPADAVRDDDDAPAHGLQDGALPPHG